MPRKNKYLTSKDIVKDVAKKYGLDRELVEKILHQYLAEIKVNLLEGKKVLLSDFGVFELTSWKNPLVYDINLGRKTERKIKTILFKPAQKLKKKVL